MVTAFKITSQSLLGVDTKLIFGNLFHRRLMIKIED